MAEGGLVIETLTAGAIAPALADLARLRVAVFREWPYLYEGTIASEQEYMAEFAQAGQAVIVAARDGERIIGAATGAPLGGHTSQFVALFAGRGFDPERIYYFGESVLLPAYRGRGIGHAFFDRREAHARALQAASGKAYTHAAFCGVVREEDDPRKPPGYVPLDAFWTKRGYRKVDGLIGHYDWKEIDAAEETRKPMQFWMRPL